MACRSKPSPDTNWNLSVSDAMSSSDTVGYARAILPRTFSFPEDHGTHLEFKTEWWYITGNLLNQNSEEFGFQFTLFRSALSPNNIHKSSTWAARQLYMGHFTITDVSNQRFIFEERLARSANGLAGAKTKPFKVWLEDWRISTNDLTEKPFPRFHLTVESKTNKLDLDLRSLKPVVLQGDSGLSQKGAELGNASYYYSLTRLKAKGQLTLNETIYEVSGHAWMDREWSTSALSKNQQGWDWFSLQLNDNTEIMVYQIRTNTGSVDSLSKGSISYPNGAYRKITYNETNLTVTGYWDSPLGGRYPSGWTLEIPSEAISLTITPKLKNQELNAQIRYWEGAVRISGKKNKIAVSGDGYVELTGYATKNP